MVYENECCDCIDKVDKSEMVRVVNVLVLVFMVVFALLAACYLQVVAVHSEMDAFARNMTNRFSADELYVGIAHFTGAFKYNVTNGLFLERRGNVISVTMKAVVVYCEYIESKSVYMKVGTIPERFRPNEDHTGEGPPLITTIELFGHSNVRFIPSVLRITKDGHIEIRNSTQGYIGKICGFVGDASISWTTTINSANLQWT